MWYHFDTRGTKWNSNMDTECLLFVCHSPYSAQCGSTKLHTRVHSASNENLCMGVGCVLYGFYTIIWAYIE